MQCNRTKGIVSAVGKLPNAGPGLGSTDAPINPGIAADRWWTCVASGWDEYAKAHQEERHWHWFRPEREWDC
jgi:hypothetical protein